MTIADLLGELLNHDTSKQLSLTVQGVDGGFTELHVDTATTDGTTIALAVLR